MKAGDLINRTLWEVRAFVKSIIEESTEHPEHYNMRIEASEGFIKVLVHNNEVNQIVGTTYQLERFLMLCKEKKIEFQLNQDVRKLIVYSAEKSKRKVQWI